MGFNGIIYSIENKVNGKRYIGKTIKPLRCRLYGHKNSIKHINSKRRICKALALAFLKYGYNNFLAKEIDNCNSIEELNLREIFWINKLNSLAPKGYNLTKGGEGIIPSDETREKMRRNHFSKKPGYINPCLGKKYSDKHKRRLRESHLGYRLSEQAKQKLRDYWKRKDPEEVSNYFNKIRKMKKLKEYQFWNNNSIIKIVNLGEYCRNNKLSRNKMISVSTGKKIQYKGFYKHDSIIINPERSGNVEGRCL